MISSSPLDLKDYRSTETLRDGRPVLLRAIRPDDKQALVEGFDRLSDESVYRRFFSPKRRLSEAELAYLTELDFERHVALIAVVREEGASLPVGVGRFIRNESGTRAEVAFTVVDRHQGRGIATALLTHLVRMARSLGVRELTAEVLADNADMMDVFRRSGLPIDVRSSGGTQHVRLRLEDGASTNGPR